MSAAPFDDVETLAAPWTRGAARDPVRRLGFRDRVVLRAERPLS